MNAQQTNIRQRNEINEPLVCDYLSNYVVSDAQGVRHAFPQLALAFSGADCDTLGYSSNMTDNDPLWAASLGSRGGGISADLEAQDASGTTYIWAGIGMISSIEDRNGNFVSYHDSGNGVFTVTDTAGRVVLNSSGFGATGNTMTVSGLSATPRLVARDLALIHGSGLPRPNLPMAGAQNAPTMIRAQILTSQ